MSVWPLFKSVCYSATRYSGLNWLLRRSASAHGVLVLCYHSIVTREHHQDTFIYRNAVPLRDFTRQLDFLTRRFSPISARDLTEHVLNGTPLKKHAMLVTFDDGYHNNLINAAPQLLKYGVPALFNLTTGYIGRDDILWPDELNLRIIHSQQSVIPYPSCSEFSLATLPRTRDQRLVVAQRIRAICKSLPQPAVKRYLEALRQTPCSALEKRDRELYDFLSWDDVRSLVKSGFEIGSHTVSHPILTHCSPAQVDYELAESKKCIENETLNACHYFVYPNGQADDYSGSVAEAAHRAGYFLAFTAESSYASPKSDPYAISRVSAGGQLRTGAFESRVSGSYSLLKKIL